MIPISLAVPGAVSGGLTWSKISCRSYELRMNNEVVAMLQRPSIWSSSYDAESNDGHWAFRRGGFLKSGAEIVDAATTHVIATLKSGWGGNGTLTFTDGQTFHLQARGLWRPVWTITTGDGQPVLRLHTREKMVELPPQAPALQNRLSLLILFAWYRVLQAREDAASVAVVVAATS